MSEKEINKCYKIVRVITDPEGEMTFHSIFTDGWASLEYKPGKVIRPQVGLIFAFEKEEQAKFWMERWGATMRFSLSGGMAFQLWECKCGSIERLPLMLYELDDVRRPNSLNTFWGKVKEGEHFSQRTATPPTGTIFTDWLKMDNMLHHMEEGVILSKS